MENYIVINGKKAELTEEQLKALGIEVEKKSPFERCKRKEVYHNITRTGAISSEEDLAMEIDDKLYNVANYCTDKDLLQQQAYREILNRLLWRYSMEHDGDKIDWNDRTKTKFYICYDYDWNIFSPCSSCSFRGFGPVFFYTIKIAQNAIEEIVKPFMEEHPDFKW